MHRTTGSYCLFDYYLLKSFYRLTFSPFHIRAELFISRMTWLFYLLYQLLSRKTALKTHFKFSKDIWHNFQVQHFLSQPGCFHYFLNCDPCSLTRYKKSQRLAITLSSLSPVQNQLRCLNLRSSCPMDTCERYKLLK